MSEHRLAHDHERGGVDESDRSDGAAVDRLLAVVARLRTDCPWDAEQTHRSLVPFLIEESYEVVEAIEAVPGDERPDHDHLVEELGDLLFQVLIHTVIAAETDAQVTLARVAGEVADKLIDRHPHVFAGEEVADDLNAAWEARKAAQKGRRSVLDGIPDLPALARAAKVVGRARARGVAVDLVPPTTVGEQILALVAAADTDPDQSLRDALRALEGRIRAVEASPTQG